MDVRKCFITKQRQNRHTHLVGAQAQRQKIAAHLNSLSLDSKTEARNLGVIIDSNLNFISHINHITRSSFHHLKNISKLRGFLSKSDSEKLIHTFITSRLDYCNGLFTGLPKASIQRLQLIQNAAARILTGTKKYQHITPILKSLHWLPIRTRIDYVTKITTHSNRLYYLHIATTKTYIFCNSNLPTRGGAGRSTLANQGSLYHASWGPRLPDASEHPAKGGQKPRGAP